MLVAVISIILGFLVLAWSADRLVEGASALACNIGVSPLLVGLTVIAFGTSAPEIFVSATASLNANPGLAIGNALGSNIANIALVLGIAALISPLTVESKILNREYPILFVIMLLLLLLISDGHLGLIDGIILLLGLIALVAWLIYTGLKARAKDPMVKEFSQEIPKGISNKLAIFYILLGFVLLPLSSIVLVNNSVFIAKALGVSDFVIGLTIIAIGTSLPEVAASVAGVLKQEQDIVIGNILGSNMFNILAVLIFPALIHPSQLSTHVLTRDMFTMFIVTILLFLFAYGFKGLGKFGRSKGVILLLCYTGYLASLYFTGLN